MQRPGMSHRGNRNALFGDRGGAAQGGSRTVFDDATAQAMESDNNTMTAELAEKVGALKNLSLDLHSEVKLHNDLLNGMQTDMDDTNSLLSNSLDQLKKLLDAGGSMHMCHLIGFVCFVFFLLYWFFTR